VNREKLERQKIRSDVIRIQHNHSNAADGCNQVMMC
jgi:hypothetical protein